MIPQAQGLYPPRPVDFFCFGFFLADTTAGFENLIPLVIGQGNFGSIDGDNAAAPRYTEAKLSKISDEMLKDINKNTVTWRPNYDNTLKEPEVLPSIIPNLLLNGGLGIAVGMATNIPPHNITEVSEALLYIIENGEATNQDLLKIVKGPDFHKPEQLSMTRKP